MICTKTLFILGAGAHVDYNLPLGNSLLKLIIDALPPNPDVVLGSFPFYGVWHAVYGGEVWASDPWFLTRFRWKLQNSGHPSIDSFLDAHERNEGLVKTGQLAVAWILRQREFFSHLFDKGEHDWMSYLFTGMFEGVDRKDPKDFLAKNNAYFVTFNYDRTLEYFFASRLIGSYDDITTKYVNEMLLPKIEIHHVYGELGKFDFENIKRDNLTPDDFKKAADGIEMMYSTRGGRKALIARVSELFIECRAIVFLGFGFDQQNINLLGLTSGATGKVVAATKVGLTQVEWNRVTTRLGSTKLNAVDELWDCMGLLRGVALW